MATLTEWPLPLNPPFRNSAYLRYLTPVQKGRLYYTKYIVDYIGELRVDIDHDNLREWKIPPGLSAGSSGIAFGIVYSPDRKRVWFALEQGGRLVEFNPATGVFTAYGGPRFSNPFRRQIPPYPFPYPRHLMFDRTGALWYTAGDPKAPLIGRLSPNRDRATYWPLPSEQATPEGIWVEETGREVWFTPIHSSSPTGAFLARLDAQSGLLTWWSYPKGMVPANAGVAAEPSINPENVWFSYDAGGPASRVFRLHLPTGEMFHYPPVFGRPGKIAIDQDGNAWISDRGGRVSRIAKNAKCGLSPLPTQSRIIRSKTQSVRAVSEEAIPVVSSSRPVSRPVNPQVDGCYLHFPHPVLVGPQPLGIAVAQGAGGPEIYFADFAQNRICLLTP